MPADRFGSSGFLDVDGATHRMFRATPSTVPPGPPFSLQVLLENLLRTGSCRGG